MDKKQILDRLAKMRAQDPFYADGKVISSVSTQPLDAAIEAYKIYSDTNALDTYIFPSTKVLEGEVIAWLGKLLDNPGAKGYVSSGGTESNIVALYAAKRMQPEKKEIVVAKNAHYSIQKAADLMGLSIKWADVDERYRADPSSVKKRIGKKTLAVVATAGTAAIGAVDPLDEIDELCDDVFFHVDAAFGGFVLPFLGRKIGFTLKNLDSATIDPHKMGQCPLPAGCVLFRGDSYLDALTIKPSYIPVETGTLAGSRSGGAIAAVWAAINLLGYDGYKKAAGECMKNTHFLCETVKDVPGVSIVAEPEMNIVGVRLPEIESTTKRLSVMGWRLAVNRELSCIRYAVMPHVKKENIKEFKKDLLSALKK